MNVDANTRTPNPCAPSDRAKYSPTNRDITWPTASPPRMRPKLRSTRPLDWLPNVLCTGNRTQSEERLAIARQCGGVCINHDPRQFGHEGPRPPT